jgi:predicted MFS family arabinose efflux permease
MSSLTSSSGSSPRVSQSLILLLSVATGLAVSTIYLLQPLLQTVAHALGIATQDVGLIVTLTQIGYGLGILLLIPLGDVLPKKTLILSKFGLLILGLILTALSGSFFAILAASLVVGIFATTAQDIVPFSADLADEKDRGAIVGKVMSGLLLGILLSRTASGFIADLLGWRSVFWVTGALILIIMVVIALTVKVTTTPSKIPYSELLMSTLRNFVTYPELRRAMMVQGLLGVAFSAFWTNLSFYVSQPPFEMSTSKIGLFGLAGAAGALAAPIAGRLSDKKGPQLGIFLGAALVLLSFIAMGLIPSSTFVLFAGAIVFDLGVQMALVSHQSIIYALNPAARARLNALFVSFMFAAFAVGSYVSVRLFAAGGWLYVIGLCVACSLVSAVFAMLGSRKQQVKA